MESDETVPESKPFPIVGIGASAGGLGALQQFLSHVPLDSGMAVVIVQHLDPDREGMLVELLQRHCLVPVVQAQDQMPVQPDQVYVIPPGRDLAILHGALHLLAPPEPRGLRLPIDTFFKSLAQDQEEHGIGVILSGMGSDGTLGLRAIRQAAGACFVQTPGSAQFDSMPRSAIDSGVADVVAPAEELPARILAFLARPHLGVDAGEQTDTPVDQKDAGLLDKIINQLRAQTGHDFSQYKKSTISRRIERRMGLHQLARLGDYLRYLRENSQEAELLFNELLIGVTSFFRDPEVWEAIKAEVIPSLIARYPDGAALRAWTPGCSTGEEAYSLAMVFKEALDALRPTHRYTLQIFASDLDKDAIATARAGVYPRGIAPDLAEARLNRFFVEDIAGYRVCNEIREMVVFAEQNVIADPPFTKLDLLSCRNLLIYLESALQIKLVQLFHYSLNPGGVLVLGNAESVGTTSGLFVPLPGKTRIFRRLDAAARVLPPDFPTAFGSALAKPGEPTLLHLGGTPSTLTLQTLVERTLLQRYAPAAVLVNGEGDLLYVNGRTGKYLEPSSGKASLNLFALARESLKQALNETFHRAIRENTVGTIKGVKLDADGAAQRVDVIVQPLAGSAGERAMALVVFIDAPASPRKRSRGAAVELPGDGERVQALARELLQAREDAQSTREEMQTSQEELKSTNEELQSTNEELQSTNEELTTSKEEMQSMNEELQTVNHELQAKLAELSRASNDMKNLLDSTEIATLFLDDALKVRRFTSQTTHIIKLIAGDAGRPITDIVTDLDYPEMTQDAQEVLRTLVFRERDVPAKADRWFRVRTMPYRTLDNRVDGVVITFTDITQSKQLESALRATQAQMATLLTPLNRQVLQMVFRRNPPSQDTLRELARQRFAQRTAKTVTALTLPEAQQLFEELEIHQIELELQNEHLNAARAQLEAALSESNELYDFSPVGSLLLDGSGTITKLNLSASRLLGRERGRLVGTKLALYLAPADAPMFDGLLEQATSSSEVEISELVLERKQGVPPAHVEMRMALLPDALGWQIILTDITERKQFEEKLRAFEARWKLALDAAGDGVWAWNVQTGQVVFSSRFVQLLGYTKKEFGRTMEDWNARLHPDDRPRVVAAYQAHLSGKTASFTSEHRAHCQDGSWKWVLSRGAIVSRSDDGHPLRMIGTYADITGQKQTEEALRVSIQIQQAVFDSLSAQLAVLDRDGIVVQTNSAWRAYALSRGVAGAPEFVGGCYFHFLDGMSGQHEPTLRAALAGIATVASGEAPRYRLPQPFFAPDDQRWFNMTVTAVHDEQERIVVSHEDVTQLKLAELASMALANSDALTSALSRRRFLNLAEQELARATRYKMPLMVLMMDLDNFKCINDRHGHAAGDLVLQGFVRTVSDVLRESDLIGRLGGEEFAVLLPNTTSEGGTALAQRIVESVRAAPIIVAGAPVAYTVSIGGGCLSSETSIAALLSRADAALYQAKRAGRDRLELAVATPPDATAHTTG